MEETGIIRKAPGVFVSFQGDVVGTNIAAVLEKLYENPPDLPTESYITIPGDTICGILYRRGYPSPCEALLPLLDRLNDKPVARLPVRDNMALTLPALEITRSSAIRVFSKTVAEQRAKGDDLVSNWRHLDAHKIEPPRSSETFGVRYNAYEFVIPAANDDAALAVFSRLVSLRSKNILISPLLTSDQGGSDLNSGEFPGVEDIQALCNSGMLKDRNDRYFNLMGFEKDALSLIQGRPAPETVPVYIIDTFLYPSPQPLPPQWTCPWGSFIKSQHHATHLAGLIGSRGKPYFFEGIANNASIQSYQWAKPDEADPTKTVKARPDRDIVLAQRFNDSYDAASILPVYLAALQFEKYLAPLADGQLQTADARYKGRLLETAIIQARPLLITAAGQPESNNEAPAPLSPTSPRSPQNLATFENVVVVTACKECGPSKPTFYDRTNYSALGFQMIHVAAPGGDPIPGWISDTMIGAAGGTSQSAAFVAGLAASMIGDFPRVYVEAKRVKKRLQVTSRPLPPQDDGTANPFARNLTAGIVDPVLALLDPAKHWIRENGKWQSVKAKRWSSPEVTFKYTSGQESRHRIADVLRLVKTQSSADPQAQPDLWTAYLDALRDHGGDIASIDRRDFIRQIEGISLILCDNTSKLLDKLEDLIIAGIGVQANECTSK